MQNAKSDFLFTVLTTSDETLVSEALFTASQALGDLSWIGNTDARLFCWDITRRTCECGRLPFRRFLWVLIMLVTPSIQQYIIQNATVDSATVVEWMRHTNGLMHSFLCGDIDSIPAFVSQITSDYASRRHTALTD